MAARVVAGDGEGRARDIGRRDARPGTSCARLIARQPLPVPMSARRGDARFSVSRMASDSSTMNSLSGRGMSTADVTRKSSPQNSRLPTM